MMKKVVLITGASSGMGKSAALILHSEGYTVYGAARRIEEMNDLKAKGMGVVSLDLINDASIVNAKDQINNFIAEKAKMLLLSESESVSQIAYTLGFNYPHYFSRLFKSKTNMTPQEYRKLS